MVPTVVGVAVYKQLNFKNIEIKLNKMKKYKPSLASDSDGSCSKRGKRRQTRLHIPTVKVKLSLDSNGGGAFKGVPSLSLSLCLYLHLLMLSFSWLLSSVLK